jgi:phenylpropionate dioxygenase-like ring-hydroxylating dioxygenase large terminal subunit
VRHQREVELLARVERAGERQVGLFGPASHVQPASAYVDPARFATEQSVLFRAGPVVIGLSVECATPGSYLTATFGGVPVAVIRQTDGTLRAMVNACRHRGAPLLTGNGPNGSGDGLRRINCGWHAWSYGTDGSLLSRPFSDGAFDDVSINCDLHQLAVAEKYGLIFVRPNSTKAIDVDAYLHGAQDDLGAFELDRCVHVESRTNVWKANWKLILDTFTESYHIRTLHRESIAPYFTSGCTIFEPFGPHLVNIGFRKSLLDELGKRADEQQLKKHGTIQYFLLPSTMLCYQVDHIELWRIEPLDVGTTKVTTSIFAETGPLTEKGERYLVKNLDILLDVTGKEDFPLCEQVHANLASGALPNVVYGRIEPALVHFHQSIDAALAAGLL